MKMFSKIVLGLLGVLTLSACGVSSKDLTPDYRYRLTVEVDTPEGLKIGSSVIEVRQSMGRTAMSGGGKRINRRVRGEAVAVDMADGQVLFALLRSENNVDWASYVMQYLAPNKAGEPWEERFDNVLQIRGEVDVPRYFRPQGHLSRRSGYPMLVKFEDIADPTTVTRVDPDDLEAAFGEGVSISRITVQVTDDPVTAGIGERLGWIGKIREMNLQLEDFPENVPVGDFSGMFKKGN